MTDSNVDPPLTETDLEAEGGTRDFEVKRDERIRLDVYIQGRLKGISRSKVQQLVEMGAMKLNGSVCKKVSTKVVRGDVITVTLPENKVRSIEPENIPLSVLYEDDYFVVVNKQAGIIVHPARSELTGTMLHALAYHFQQAARKAGVDFDGWETKGFQPDAPEGADGRDEMRRLGRIRNEERKRIDGLLQLKRQAEAGKSADPDEVRGLTVAEQDMARGEIENLTGKASIYKSETAIPVQEYPELSPEEEAEITGGKTPDGIKEGEIDGRVQGLSNVGVKALRPGIVHRLDRYTTGVMVVAKNDRGHWNIARQFERRLTKKAYLALVHGEVPEEDGVVGDIDQPLGKHPTSREAFAVRHDAQAKPSLTVFRVRERYRGYTLLELDLKTGRTHQIRVHLQYMGWPIVGDLIYGGEPMGIKELDDPPRAAGSRRFMTFARQKEEGLKILAAADKRRDLLMVHPALHAAYLQFYHPHDNRPVSFCAPLHEPELEIVRQLRKRRIDGPVATKDCLIDLDLVIPPEISTSSEDVHNLG